METLPPTRGSRGAAPPIRAREAHDARELIPPRDADGEPDGGCKRREDPAPNLSAST